MVDELSSDVTVPYEVERGRPRLAFGVGERLQEATRSERENAKASGPVLARVLSASDEVISLSVPRSAFRVGWGIHALGNRSHSRLIGGGG